MNVLYCLLGRKKCRVAASQRGNWSSSLAETETDSEQEAAAAAFMNIHISIATSIFDVTFIARYFPSRTISFMSLCSNLFVDDSSHDSFVY